MPMRSSSSLPAASFLEKARQVLTFFHWRFAWSDDAGRLDRLLEELAELPALYEKLSGQPAHRARIFEIGYGARPVRLIALHSMGFDVTGIDLDVPMLQWSTSRLLQILRTNGVERALKTAVRNLFFDRREQKALASVLARRGYSLRMDPSRLLVGDAARFPFQPHQFDFLYSFDVFEHIPRPDLETLTAHLAHALAPGGIALIAPQIYTGICGGHLPEWSNYMATQSTPRSTRPWEHLHPSPLLANVYLNRLTRADYRAIFSAHFQIIEEIDRMPNRGRHWLTPQLRRQLAAWTDEDLFSNVIWFVLKKSN